jgi:hypothetical protein
MIYVQQPQEDLTRQKTLLEIENLKKDGEFKDAQIEKARRELRQMKRPQVLRAVYLVPLIVATILVSGTITVGYKNDWWKTEMTLSKASETRMGNELKNVKYDVSLKDQKLKTYESIFAALPQEEQKRMLTDMVGKLAEVSQQQSKLEGMFFATTTTQAQMVTPSLGYMLGAVQNAAGPAPAVLQYSQGFSFISTSGVEKSPISEFLQLSSNGTKVSNSDVSFFSKYKTVVDEEGNERQVCERCGKSPGHLCIGTDVQYLQQGATTNTEKLFLGTVCRSLLDSLPTGSSLFKQQ